MTPSHNDYRIGLVALASDITVESDFRRMLPPDGPQFFVSRVAYANSGTVDGLRGMATEIASAADLILPGERIDCVAYGCTSATTSIGAEGVTAAVAEAKPGTPVATPITGAVKACEAFGIGRVAVITPYIDEVNATIRAFLEQSGIAVPRLHGFGFTSDYDFAAVPADDIIEAALELNGDDVDAIFLSCTALRSTGLIEQLEERTGKPVLSSNQCLLWESLRLGGCDLRIQGYGRLMAV